MSRKRGWRKPPGAVVVSRPSKWGNPYKVAFYPCANKGKGEDITAEKAVDAFKRWIYGSRSGRRIASQARRELRGKDLLCWCPIGAPCHGDVLIEIANQKAKP